MSRLIAILAACLALVAVLDAIGSGRQASLRVDRLSVSAGGDELQREPFHDGQGVTLRADTGESLAIALYADGMQTAGVLTVAGSVGRVAWRPELIRLGGVDVQLAERRFVNGIAGELAQALRR